MQPMTYPEADNFGKLASGPFSFFDFANTRVTMVQICGKRVTTAALCVDENRGHLIVQSYPESWYRDEAQGVRR